MVPPAFYRAVCTQPWSRHNDHAIRQNAPAGEEIATALIALGVDPICGVNVQKAVSSCLTRPLLE